MRTLKLLQLLILTMLVVSSCSSLPGRADTRTLVIKNKAAGYQDDGIRQYNSGRYNQALDLFELAYQLNASIDNGEGMVLTLNSIGKTKMSELKYVEALEFFEKAIIMSERINDRLLILRSRGNLGDYYSKIGELDTAYELLFREMENQKSINSEESAYIAHSLSLILRKKGNYDEALVYLEQSLNFNKKEKAYRALAADYYMLASINSLQKKYPDAFFYAKEALHFDKMIEYSQGIASDLDALSIISDKMGNLIEAENYKKRSEAVLNAISNINEIEIEETELDNNQAQ